MSAKVSGSYNGVAMNDTVYRHWMDYEDSGLFCLYFHTEDVQLQRKFSSVKNILLFKM